MAIGYGGAAAAAAVVWSLGGGLALSLALFWIGGAAACLTAAAVLAPRVVQPARDRMAETRALAAALGRWEEDRKRDSARPAVGVPRRAAAELARAGR